MSYRSWLQTSAPGFFQGKNAQAVLGGIGAALDTVAQSLIAAVKLRFPNYYLGSVLQTPADALAQIGDERQLQRAPSETDAAYAARLQDAWNEWPWGGTAYGLLRALWVAGMTTAIVVQQNGLAFNLAADGLTMVTTQLAAGSFTFDAIRPTFWSKFAIIFPLGTTALTTAQQASLSQIVKQWAPGFATYVGATLITSGRLWGWPQARWGDPGLTWGGTSINYGP